MRTWTACLTAAALCVLCAGPARAFTDDFEDDPLTDPDWDLYQPVAGVTFQTDDSLLKVTIPSGVNLDHWVTVDAATQLRRADVPESFILETRVFFVGSGDIDAPLWPPIDESYQPCLMVYFGVNDVFQWGFYRGTRLRLERSGQNNLCEFDPGLQEVSLQVKKVGTQYSFSWRADDADPWTLVCTQDVADPVQYVGYMFKSWAPTVTMEEHFEFDYFTLEEVPNEAPEITMPCDPGAPDRAWIGMPYSLAMEIAGFPVPVFSVTEGPEDLAYDPVQHVVGGWTPDTFGNVAVTVEATNDLGSDSASWNVDVVAPSSFHDDEFDDDPRDNDALWEFYEPQTGVQYSIEDPGDGSSWLRMDVPLLGDFGQNFDVWTTVDNAPQFRYLELGEDDWLIETRVRVVPGQAPQPADPWLAGLMIYFDQFDLIHWNIGQERNINGLTTNVFLERAGTNNIANQYAAGVATGSPVKLRIKKQCNTYSFFYQAEGDAVWSLGGVYETDTPVVYVGLIMKTWGAGTAFAVDFDYFDVVEPGPQASFTMDPAEGIAPLTVSFDASASSSPGGAITAYEWDFGDGETAAGATTSHEYPDRGNYTVTLTVTDATGDHGSSSQVVQAKFASGDVTPWISADVGDPPPVQEGGARTEDADCLRILSGGRDIGGTADQFHFVYQPLEGDGSVQFRLSEVDWPQSAKIGVMIREDLSPGSRHASVLMTNNILAPKFTFIHRDVPDAMTAFPPVTSADQFAVPDAWVRIERSGQEVIGSYSTDGAAWTELSRVTLDLPAAALAGIAATPRDLAGDGRAVEAKVCELALEGGTSGGGFHRGDSNGDGSLNITDGIFVLNFLFLGGETPSCMEAANANDDADLNITDGIYILNYLFLGGPAPLPPGPPESPCGSDPADSPSDLGCDVYEGC